jgi:hypothetical protein
VQKFHIISIQKGFCNTIRIFLKAKEKMQFFGHIFPTIHYMATTYLIDSEDYLHPNVTFL